MVSVKDLVSTWPKTTLFIIFLGWKSFLLILALCSPGPGYDTSTSITHPSESKHLPFLVRWDAIYYTAVSKRGYLYEQEWAFSWGFTQLVRLLSRQFRHSQEEHDSSVEIWIAVFISHVSHLLAVLVMYLLSGQIFRDNKRSQTIAFTSACLHVISPAGIFLSAPYSESLFAALQFLGYYYYVCSWQQGRPEVQALASNLLSGLFFGLAVLVRNNGLLSGIPFAIDAIYCGVDIIKGIDRRSKLRRLLVTITAGLCIFLGAAGPQILAWARFCGNGLSATKPRPWCSKIVPSIYTFVQSHYWNCGPFKYWTLSNLPLFLISVPVFYTLFRSTYWAVGQGPDKLKSEASATNNRAIGQHELHGVLQRIGMTQGVFALVILLQSHVQIVNRLCSAYPVWYWWLAFEFVGMPRSGRMAESVTSPKSVTRWMIAYAVVQGGLYSSFLPPA